MVTLPFDPRTQKLATFCIGLFLFSLVFLLPSFSSRSSSDPRPSIHPPSHNFQSFTPGVNTTYFLSSATRGIGLELARQLATDPHAWVVAGAREPERASVLAEMLEGMEGRGRVVKLDVTSQGSIDAMVRDVEEIGFVKEGGGLDVVLHVAGLMSGGFGLASAIKPTDLVLDTLTNFHAPILLTSALLPLLSPPSASPSHPHPRPRKIFVLSSILGSMDSFPSMKGYSAAYSATKTAVDMWVRKLAWEFANEGPWKEREGGWVVGSLHPGFVPTEMTRGRGDITVQESARGVLRTLAAVGVEHTGEFFDWEGRPMGW